MPIPFSRRSLISATVAALLSGAIVLPVTSSAQSGTANVRAWHASPDAPAVDVYVDGQRAIANLAFGHVSPYAAVPAGERRIQVFAAGANPASATAVIDARVSPMPGRNYSVIATGPVAEIAPIVVEDAISPPGQGKTKVRVLHLSPDAPPVDIAVTGGPVLVRNLAFRDVTPYLELDAGTYNLEVRVAGTNQVALALPNTRLQAGDVLSVAAIGFLTTTPIRAQVAVDARFPQPVEPGSDPQSIIARILAAAARSR
ncbi:MAG: cell wall anchor [Dehalococcoidia bacterium]|nr:MAG: cell wall anchor [Dehalococcoidia bacterium]